MVDDHYKRPIAAGYMSDAISRDLLENNENYFRKLYNTWAIQVFILEAIKTKWACGNMHVCAQKIYLNMLKASAHFRMETWKTKMLCMVQVSDI